MKIPKPPATLVELFDSVLAKTPGERRMMFGCPCGFLGGNMFCGLFGSTMFVRLAEQDRAALLSIDGASTFDPMGGRPMKEYVVLPPDLAEDEGEAARWAQRAADYAAALPPKNKTTTKAKAKKTARKKAKIAARR